MHGPHFIGMTVIMIVSGLLSTMNVWADKWDDIRLSINDAYMIGLMTGWMLLFMGLWLSYLKGTLAGVFLVGLCLIGIRTQAFVSERQFLLGMIPHHSMAIHMSKQLQKKPNSISSLLDTIIGSQEKEIRFMKQKLKSRSLETYWTQ